MSSRNQYVVNETLISMAINTALSIGFVFLVFHGRSVVPASGPHGVVLDMAPQTFMVVLMSCLVPALLTRKRHVAGAFDWHRSEETAALRGIVTRAFVLGVFATGLVVSLSWVALPHLLPAGIAFGALLVAKAVFGMLLAAAATPWAIAKVLK
jgi:hypothetical protein